MSQPEDITVSVLGDNSTASAPSERTRDAASRGVTEAAAVTGKKVSSAISGLSGTPLLVAAHTGPQRLNPIVSSVPATIRAEESADYLYRQWVERHSPPAGVATTAAAPGPNTQSPVPAPWLAEVSADFPHAADGAALFSAGGQGAEPAASEPPTWGLAPAARRAEGVAGGPAEPKTPQGVRRNCCP